MLGVTLGTDVRILFLLLCIPLTLATYLALYNTPALLARRREKEINKQLRLAVHYFSVHYSSGVSLPDLFYHIACQEHFGELQQEANWIYRDLSLLNHDIITTLEQATRITPSALFKEFLQGININIQHGGDLASYFQNKATELQQQVRTQQRILTLRIGVLTGIYCLVGIIGGLLVTLLLSHHSIITPDSLLPLTLFIFIGLPLLHLVFAFLIKTTKEAVL